MSPILEQQEHQDRPIEITAPDSKNNYLSTEYNLTLLQLNVQSLLGKLPDVRFDIENIYNCDIMFLSETWLKQETPSRFLTISGYNLIRKDRPITHAHPVGYGGVAILLKSHYKYEILQTSASPSQSNLEIIWVKVTVASNTIVLASVYRPPVYTVKQIDADLDHLEFDIQDITIRHPNVKVIIGGDMNCCLLKTHQRNEGFKLSKLLDSYKFHICNITQSTYKPANTLLDIIAINDENCLLDTNVIDCFYSTPHRITAVKIYITTNIKAPLGKDTIFV